MGSFNLTADLEEKTVAMATEYETEGGNKQLGLSLRVDRTETCDVLLHAPYWIINKTGLPLQIRVSSILTLSTVLKLLTVVCCCGYNILFGRQPVSEQSK
jgi:hypothetical protein